MLRSALTPAVVAFVLSSRLRRNPYPLLRALQRIDPRHKSPIGIWILNAHADVANVLRDPRLGSDEDKADPETINLGVFGKLLNRGERPEQSPFRDVFRQLMLFRDAPDHTRLRKLVTKAFTPRRIEELGPRVTEITNEILDRVEPSGGMDLMHELAYPLPARVICELVGVPEKDQPFVIKHAPALATGLDPSPMRSKETVARADIAALEVTSYMHDLIETRRNAPRDDLLSDLIAAEEDGDRLSRDELVAMVILLLMAGHETTANLIGNGVHALVRNPKQFERLRDDPCVEQSAIEELLRFDPPVQMAERITLEQIELGDEKIPPGHILIPIIASANRDPAVFDGPKTLDLARTPNPHLSFSGGAHFCIGAPLARLEGRIVLTSLVRRFPKLRVERKTRRKSFTIRGFSSLEVAWS